MNTLFSAGVKNPCFDLSACRTKGRRVTLFFSVARRQDGVIRKIVNRKKDIRIIPL